MVIVCQMIAVVGMSTVVHRLDAIVAVMKRKSYDWLDPLQTQFDIDYEEFQQQIEELHVCNNFIYLFMELIS